jgi:type I site-specific restriction endonuclease
VRARTFENDSSPRRIASEISGSAIPAVKIQLGDLAALQETAFWEGIGVVQLEDLRLRLRGLVPFLDRKKRTIVYTDFQDRIVSVRESDVIAMPRMTSAQYEQRVRSYLDQHRDHLVIHKLRTNQPLTTTDLDSLETALVEIGDGDGETLLDGLLARSESPSLAYLRARSGGHGPRRGARRVLGVPGRSQPDAAPDPLRRDGHRAAHLPRRDDSVGALRTAVHRPARGGA